MRLAHQYGAASLLQRVYSCKICQGASAHDKLLAYLDRTRSIGGASAMSRMPPARVPCKFEW